MPEYLAGAASLFPAYDRAYRERRGSDGPLVFEAAEQNALLAMAYVRRALRASAPASDDLALVVDLTGEPLARRLHHSVATDIAGIVWAEAFGSLPIAEPPIVLVSRVFDSVVRPEDVRGVLAVGWRMRFLVVALPYLDWVRRPRAEAELERRLQQLRARRPSWGAVPTSPKEVSQAARLAYLLLGGELAATGADLESAARSLVEALDLVQGDAAKFALDGIGRGVSTTLLSQLLLAAHAAARSPMRERVRTDLVGRRRANEDGLLRADSRADAMPELSPWVALALAECDDRDAGREPSAAGTFTRAQHAAG